MSILSYITCLFTVYLWDLINGNIKLNYSALNIFKTQGSSLQGSPTIPQELTVEQLSTTTQAAAQSVGQVTTSSVTQKLAQEVTQPVSQAATQAQAQVPVQNTTAPSTPSQQPATQISNLKQSSMQGYNRSPFSNQQQFKTGNPSF